MTLYRRTPRRTRATRRVAMATKTNGSLGPSPGPASNYERAALRRRHPPPNRLKNAPHQSGGSPAPAGRMGSAPAAAADHGSKNPVNSSIAPSPIRSEKNRHNSRVAHPCAVASFSSFILPPSSFLLHPFPFLFPTVTSLRPITVINVHDNLPNHRPGHGFGDML
jgi:hypothetical protein